MYLRTMFMAFGCRFFTLHTLHGHNSRAKRLQAVNSKHQSRCKHSKAIRWYEAEVDWLPFSWNEALFFDWAFSSIERWMEVYIWILNSCVQYFQYWPLTWMKWSIKRNTCGTYWSSKSQRLHQSRFQCRANLRKDKIKALVYFTTIYLNNKFSIPSNLNTSCSRVSSFRVSSFSCYIQV